MLYPPKGKERAVTRQELSDYQVPTVDELRAKYKGREGTGRRWQPIPHGDLIDEITSAARNIGLVIEEEAFSVSADGHDIYGFMRFDPSTAPSMPDVPGSGGITPELGFRHSNMQRFRLLGVHGEHVAVCSNGMMVGDFLFGFKTTKGNVDNMERGIADGMEEWTRQAEDAKRLIEFLVGEGVDYDRADQLLMEGARRGSYAWNQLGKIDATYRDYVDPKHPHHEAFADRNLWSLYNAVTEVAKGWSVRNVERGLKGFPRVLADAYGFELSALVEDTPEGASSLSFAEPSFGRRGQRTHLQARLA